MDWLNMPLISIRVAKCRMSLQH